MIHANSLHAYADILPSLSKRQNEVLKVIQDNPGKTIREIAKLMNTESHTISGRFSELEKKGKIKSMGKTYFNNRPHEMWQAA